MSPATALTMDFDRRGVVTHSRGRVGLTEEMMVAALVELSGVTRDEMRTPARVREEIEMALAVGGVAALDKAVDRLATNRARAWDRFCRQAVAEMLAAEGAR
ncbi:hypothetical protein FDG2_1403 [Candidatus Protofrankia californiensis]|uniref:Uncharacterized protein n=1 Tax=Candidatus Protofrankia californiensis TaxID=1839754 RepID=A0A1C3NVH9_9ACTN|nr:hypothetical protein FDG2_1403 [Candidatus Protofrankia californiensis]